MNLDRCGLGGPTLAGPLAQGLAALGRVFTS